MNAEIVKGSPSKISEGLRSNVLKKLSKKSSLNARKRPSHESLEATIKDNESNNSKPKKKNISFANSVKEIQFQMYRPSTSATETKQTVPKLPAPAKWQKTDKGENKSAIKHNLVSIKKSKPLLKISSSSLVKPNWKDIKDKNAELRKKRKEKKVTNYDMILQAKKIWEQVRRVDCPATKKAELIVSLHELIKENIVKIVFAHDTSRIVQWLLKLASPVIRSSICDSLCPVIVEMMQKRFSSHCIRNVLTYGDKDCVNKVLSILSGNVMKLLTNNISAPIVERIYSNHASADQKKSIEQEFFGNSWKVAVGSEMKSLKEAVATSTEMKKSILQDTRENIIRVINKNVTSSSLVHSVISQFLDVCTSEDKAEILGLLSSHITDLIETKAGARISMQCCWFSTKKVKKSIIKQLKGKVTKVSTMEDGFWVILALLDSVDDTILLKKAIVSEILVNVTGIIKNEYGRKVVLYLVSHRDKLYFHPGDIAFLEQGDNSSTALKSLDTRRSEILPFVMESLLQSIQTDVSFWMHDASVAMVTLAVLKAGSGKHLKNALNILAKFVCNNGKIEDVSLVEHAGIHLVLKKLLKFDQTRDLKEDMFAYHLACQLDEQNIQQFSTCNRGCFLLVNILETGKEEPREVLLGKMEGKFKESITAAQSTGARVLHKILTEFIPDLKKD